jgi:protein-S-isoprenylcysteine O-methyltransferase Ste14
MARSVAAVTISTVSFSMAGAAASGFRRRGTTLEPLHPDRASALVTDGANAISRNPMYLGLAGLLLGHAVWRGSWTALLPVVGFVVYIDRAQIRAEEAALLERFGAAYESYRATTPRWIDRRSVPSLSQRLHQRAGGSHGWATSVDGVDDGG